MTAIHIFHSDGQYNYAIQSHHTAEVRLKMEPYLHPTANPIVDRNTNKPIPGSQFEVTQDFQVATEDTRYFFSKGQLIVIQVSQDLH